MRAGQTSPHVKYAKRKGPKCQSYAQRFKAATYLLQLSKQALTWNPTYMLWLCYAGFILRNYGMCIYGHQGPHIQVRSELRKCVQGPMRRIQIATLPGASSVCVALRIRRPAGRFIVARGIQPLRSTPLTIAATVRLRSPQHRAAKLEMEEPASPAALPIARRRCPGRFAKKQKAFVRRPCPCSSSGCRV